MMSAEYANLKSKVKMSNSDFISQLWLVCTVCRQVFSPDPEKLKYKIRNHSKDCKSSNLIVFEELILDKRVNHNSAQPPKKKKKYFNHQRNKDQEQNVCANVNSESLPEIEIVAPNAKPCIDVSPTHVELSSISSSVTESSSIDLLGKEHNPSTQNIEENESKKQPLVTTSTLVSDPQQSQQDQIQNTEITTNTSTLALPSLLNVGKLNKTQVNNNESDHLIKTVNPKPNPVKQVILILKVIGTNGNHIKSPDIIKNTPSELEINPKFSQEEISISTTPISSVSVNSSTNNNSSNCLVPNSITVETSECKSPRWNIQTKSQESEIIYSESDIPSDCNLEVITFDDHQDHQRSCTEHNLVDLINNENNITSSNQHNQNGGELMICEDATELGASLIINSHKDNLISSEVTKITEISPTPTATASRNQKQTQKLTTKHNLALLEWLKTQSLARFSDGTKNHINLVTSKFLTSKPLGVNNPIICTLCKTKLQSKLHLINHVKNCWLHNQSNHRYCVPCGKTFAHPQSLANHFQSKINRVKHDPFRRTNGPHILDSNTDQTLFFQKHKQDPNNWYCTVCHKVMENELLFNAHQESLKIFLGKSPHAETEYEEMGWMLRDAVDPTQPPHDIPGQKGTMANLSTWLKDIRKSLNSDGTFLYFVLIDPEPTSTSQSHSSSAELGSSSDELSVEINEDNPITCRLCLLNLTQFDEVKSHVSMCWNQNKKNHRYCVFCDKGFPTPIELEEHRTSEHSAPKNIVLFYRRGRGTHGGDQSINVDGLLKVNSENPVICKLCEAELATTLQAKIHSENCWLHNKARHIFCTICNRRFEDPHKLGWHNRIRHRNPQSGVECRISENEMETDKLLPLSQWLQKFQKENPNNFIALEPDPSTCEILISESSPVRCTLCKKLLTTESRLRNHVKTCWIYNKEKHRYCVTCNQHFRSNHRLVKHQKAKHPSCSQPLWKCVKCNHEFLTGSELTKHTESLQEFSLHMKNYAIKPPDQKVTNSVDTSPGSDNTMAILFEWLEDLRQVKTADGRENIILVDPEPTSDNFDEISPENPITCRLCLQKFTTALTLKSHVENCWTEKKEMHILCVTCDKVFETPQNLQDHTRKEHSELAGAAPLICKFCSQEFCDKKTFQDHEEGHKDLNFRPFKCPHCSIKFRSEKHLLKHTAALQRKYEKVPVYNCKICLKSFTDRFALNDHNRAAHEGEIITCIFPNCGYSCSSPALRQHHYHSKHSEELREEPPEFPCLKCGKVYKQRGILNRHIKLSHTQEKPHKCTHDGCEKAFKKRLQLIEHERVHTGETPYQCEECGKTFARLWTFLKHRRSHEGTINPAHCHLCPRKFQGGWELKEHLLKIHKKGEEFKCKICHVQCPTQSYLKRHKKIHINERNSDSDGEAESQTDSDV